MNRQSSFQRNFPNDHTKTKLPENSVQTETGTKTPKAEGNVNSQSFRKDKDTGKHILNHKTSITNVRY